MGEEDRSGEIPAGGRGLERSGVGMGATRVGSARKRAHRPQTSTSVSDLARGDVPEVGRRQAARPRLTTATAPT